MKGRAMTNMKGGPQDDYSIRRPSGDFRQNLGIRDRLFGDSSAHCSNSRRKGICTRELDFDRSSGQPNEFARGS